MSRAIAGRSVTPMIRTTLALSSSNPVLLAALVGGAVAALFMAIRGTRPH